jgi:hypothetical protein
VIERERELDTFIIRYIFHILDSNKKTEYSINIDRKTVVLQPENDSKPAWAKLEDHQCENCPFNKKEQPLCPIAKNLADVTDCFKDEFSYAPVKVVVETEERSYFRNASLQEGLFSIFGIIMATSGCPHLDFLKPMGRYHLPFSTVDETLFRSTASFLLGQYIFNEKDTKDDKKRYGLKPLFAHYAEVSKVNRGIIARINSIANKDADKNAIVILENFAQIISMEINSNLESLEYLFVNHDT